MKKLILDRINCTCNKRKRSVEVKFKDFRKNDPVLFKFLNEGSEEFELPESRDIRGSI